MYEERFKDNCYKVTLGNDWVYAIVGSLFIAGVRPEEKMKG